MSAFIGFNSQFIVISVILIYLSQYLIMTSQTSPFFTNITSLCQLLEQCLFDIVVRVQNFYSSVKYLLIHNFFFVFSPLPLILFNCCLNYILYHIYMKTQGMKTLFFKWPCHHFILFSVMILCLSCITFHYQQVLCWEDQWDQHIWWNLKQKPSKSWF